MKLVLEQMAEEDGVYLLYHTFFSEALVDEGVITHLVVQNKNGRQVIAAGQVIDATGDADDDGDIDNTATVDCDQLPE